MHFFHPVPVDQFGFLRALEPDLRLHDISGLSSTECLPNLLRQTGTVGTGGVLEVVTEVLLVGRDDADFLSTENS